MSITMNGIKPLAFRERVVECPSCGGARVVKDIGYSYSLRIDACTLCRRAAATNRVGSIKRLEGKNAETVISERRSL